MLAQKPSGLQYLLSLQIKSIEAKTKTIMRINDNVSCLSCDGNELVMARGESFTPRNYDSLMLGSNSCVLTWPTA